MASQPDKQVAELLAEVTAHCSKHKGQYVEKTIAATKVLMTWLQYLRSNVSSHVADRLLDATQGAIIETAGCLSLGLVRPAIFSIRAQLELILAWIYFNDHPVEWSCFERNKRDYQLPSATLAYLRNNSDKYSDRFQLLEKSKTRKTRDLYSVLSVYVHSNVKHAAPKVAGLAGLVQSTVTCDECIRLQQEVTEYVTDVLASWYADRWHDLPKELTSELRSRLQGTSLKKFCE